MHYLCTTICYQRRLQKKKSIKFCIYFVEVEVSRWSSESLLFMSMGNQIWICSFGLPLMTFVEFAGLVLVLFVFLLRSHFVGSFLIPLVPKWDFWFYFLYCSENGEGNPDLEESRKRSSENSNFGDLKILKKRKMWEE